MLKFNIINSIAIVLLLVVVAFKVHYSYAVFILICWLILTIIGSFHIRWNYHVNSLNANGEITKKYVALTFDDGPNKEFTPLVLGLLKKYNAKATFFCIGKNIKKHPELFKKIIADGHTVGNHTYSHNAQFGFYSVKNVINEIKITNELIAELTEKKNKLFRPPFGVTNPSIKKALKLTDMQSIGWNIRSLDTTSKSSKAIISQIKKKVKRGDVILLHDTSEKSIAVLEQLLVYLNQQELESVTIPTLFNIKAYA